MKIKSLMSCALSAVILLAAASAQAAPNLTGTWVLDRSQSQFHQPDAADGKGRHGRKGGHREGAGRGESKLIVTQDGNALRVTRAMAKDGQERTFTQTYLLDGTEQTAKVHRGAAVTKALYDGDRLLVNTSYTKTTKEDDKTMSRASVWTVSPDGQTLTIETTMQSPRGERQMKTVYQKA